MVVEQSPLAGESSTDEANPEPANQKIKIKNWLDDEMRKTLLLMWFWCAVGETSILAKEDEAHLVTLPEMRKPFTLD